ncbi:MAG: hypothetical protein SOU50_06620, partial [Oscillospiraceae bacterium]|nr:hypothetical protein [Oscillospiraceae bacterium]
MSSYVKPAAAFKKLDAAKLLKQNVYIYGATGFGKTELVKQYFRNTKYTYILCRQNHCDLSPIPESSPHTVTVVIDNVNAAESSEIRNSILSLCGRKNLWVLIIGRSRMPSWLFNTFITKSMALITEDDIALPEEGIDQYMRSEGIILTEEELRYLKKCSEGNFYGLKYTARRLLSGDRIGNELYEQNSAMFQSYAINNIISEFNTEVADFLLKVSIADDFTEQLAVMLTGNTDVLRLIERAMDAGNFIYEKNGVYTIRRQFIKALRKKASMDFSEKELHQYALLAGGYYESNNEDDRALEMYAAYGESDRIRELLIKNSRKNPESGYYIEMRKYYLMLSEEDIMCSAYLMAAMSMLYSMLMDFDKSDYWYDKLVKYRDNARGSEKREATQRIVYLEISLPHRGSINILELIKGCYALLTDKSIPFPELSVTSNQPSLMNGGKDFCDWSRHDREIAAAAGKPVVTFLGKYGKGLVNAALAESFFEKGGDRCAADRNIDKKWFERIRTETGKMARRYPLYLKNTAKNIPELQPMDIRILTCLADGLSVQKTAEKLNINYETLRSRIKEIYR